MWSSQSANSQISTKIIGFISIELKDCVIIQLRSAYYRIRYKSGNQKKNQKNAIAQCPKPSLCRKPTVPLYIPPSITTKDLLISSKVVSNVAAHNV
jgi:hypothetical protein